MKYQKFLLFFGTISALSLGVFSAVYSFRKSDNQNPVGSSEFNLLNEAINDINGLYEEQDAAIDASVELINLNTDNIDDFNDVFSKELFDLKKNLDDSNNAIVDAYQQEIEDAIDAIILELTTHEQLNEDDIDAIMSTINDLNQDLLSINGWQTIIETEIAQIESETTDIVTQLWTSMTILQQLTSQLTTNVDVNTTNIGFLNGSVNAINIKLSEIDVLTAELETVQLDLVTFNQFLIDVEGRVSDNEIEITAINNAITAISTTLTALDTNIQAIEQAIDDIEVEQNIIVDRLNSLDLALQLQGDTTDALATAVTDIQTAITNIMAIQSTTTAQQIALGQQLADALSEIDNLQTQATNFDQQLTFLVSQNNTFASDLLLINTQLTTIQNTLDNITNVKNSINYAFNKVILDNSDTNNQIVNFDPIWIADLDDALRFSMDVEILDTDSNISYVVKIIDSYPTPGFALLGEAINLTYFNYAININITVNTINISGLFFQEKVKVWKNINDLNEKIIITIKNITVLY